MSNNTKAHYKAIFVGGGLANGLLAYRISELYPEFDFIVLESDSKLGGNHTWCFNTSDVTTEQLKWLKPLIKISWESYTIDLPDIKKEISGGYHAITSESFREVISKKCADKIIYGVKAKSLTATEVVLDDGRVFTADIVIDGRGITEAPKPPVGWQKFLGLDLELEHEHNLKNVILIEAEMPQPDDCQFFYILPWSKTELLIEDTYYSDTYEVDVNKLRQRIMNYAAKRGWKVNTVKRMETSALPLAMVDEWLEPPGENAPIISGVRGGFFNPMTAYSFPFAMKYVEWFCSFLKDNKLPSYQEFRTYAERHWKSMKFYRLLNKELFKTAPTERYKIIQRTYMIFEEEFVNSFLSGDSEANDQKILK